MDYSFSVTRHPEYLHVKIEGENNMQTVRAYIEDIRAACEREQCGVVLIEEHLRGPRMRMMEVFTLVTEEAKRVGPILRQVAFVDANPESTPNMAFAEDVAVNRGVFMRVFANAADAEAWLKQPRTS
jgi:hypothetical protein